MSGLRLDTYFERIGYGGGAAPTLETLRALHRLQPAAIPYETIDMLLGGIVDLTPAAVEAKLVGRRRGGACHEQNLLFKRVLTAMGYEVEGLICRSRYGWPADHIQARGHTALRVHLGGAAWLVDVGFGGWMLTAPVCFATREAQATSFEPVRLRPIGDEVRLEVLFGERWVPVYDVAPGAQHEVDWFDSLWRACTHPDSIYRRRLMVSLTTPTRRYALRDAIYTVREPDGSARTQPLAAAELETCLSEVFGLEVESEWRPALEAAARASS